jgi:hypothetical protein
MAFVVFIPEATCDDGLITELANWEVAAAFVARLCGLTPVEFFPLFAGEAMAGHLIGTSKIVLAFSRQNETTVVKLEYRSKRFFFIVANYGGRETSCVVVVKADFGSTSEFALLRESVRCNVWVAPHD